MRYGVDTVKPARWSFASLPWLAVPFLVLLGFSLTIMPRNPANPGFDLRESFWDRYVLQSLSWISLDRVANRAESFFYLSGIHPDDAEHLATGIQGPVPPDPWGQSYRLVNRGERLFVTGSDGSGQPIQVLILSRHLPWEGGGERFDREAGPGVQLIP